jgi:sterol desaturase/sphingolipid hydroxylase (fatty acid hydroxylase superfamily)
MTAISQGDRSGYSHFAILYLCVFAASALVGSLFAFLQERRIFSRLRRVIRNSRKVIGVSRNVSMMTSGYGYLIQIIPIAIVVPGFFRGEVQFGVVTQSAMA